MKKFNIKTVLKSISKIQIYLWVVFAFACVDFIVCIDYIINIIEGKEFDIWDKLSFVGISIFTLTLFGIFFKFKKIHKDGDTNL